MPRYLYLIRDLGNYIGLIRNRRRYLRKEKVQVGLFIAFVIIIEVSLWYITPPIENLSPNCDGNQVNADCEFTPAGPWGWCKQHPNSGGSCSLLQPYSTYAGAFMHKMMGVFGFSCFILGPALGFFNGIFPAWAVTMIFGEIDDPAGNSRWWKQHAHR